MDLIGSRSDYLSRVDALAFITRDNGMHYMHLNDTGNERLW